MNLIQKIRVAKVKTNQEGQYKTLYKIFDSYGKFLYYQVGKDGDISEFLEDFMERGYYFYDYKFNRLDVLKVH